MTALAALFALTAALYASVGFGGGSTYVALLLLGGTDYALLPVVALICNVIVVTGGSLRYALAGHVPWRRLAPVLALSVPLAWLGGSLPIERTVFIVVLGLSLLVAGLLLVFQRQRSDESAAGRWDWKPAAAIGGAIGFLSGIVGIGGGIFLAPILHLVRWDVPHRIAASASVFILVNSIAGIAGQLGKPGQGQGADVIAYWPLFLAVFVGGQIGSFMGIRVFKPATVRIATAILILYVALRLLWQAAGV